MDFSPIWISIKTGIVSVIITFFLGIMAARWSFSRKNKLTAILADVVFTMPLVLPPTVAGFFLLWIFGVNQPVGRFFWSVFGIKIAFQWIATVLAAVVISFPLMYRSAKGAFEQVDSELIYAARTLGMPENTIFWKVLLPNAIPGIIAGGVLAFARGLGEFGATAMLAGNIPGITRTLPLAVYTETAGGNMKEAGKYVAVICVICFVAVVGLNIYQAVIRKKQAG